jgi:hypothetical protein
MTEPLPVSPFELVTLTATHARHLRRLLGEPLVSVVAPTASKAVMLAALQAAEIELLQTIALVSPGDADRTAVCGFWTLHDLIGHLADWDRYFLNWLAAMTDGRQQELYWDEDGGRSLQCLAL